MSVCLELGVELGVLDDGDDGNSSNSSDGSSLCVQYARHCVKSLTCVISLESQQFL